MYRQRAAVMPPALGRSDHLESVACGSTTSTPGGLGQGAQGPRPFASPGVPVGYLSHPPNPMRGAPKTLCPF